MMTAVSRKRHHQALIADPEGDLGPRDRQRFARHLMLDEIGEKGQARLAAARVLLIGVGGLGSASALYLAAAGIGTLGLADHDQVELSNLQRQVLYGEADLGRPKVEIAARRLRKIRRELVVEPHRTEVVPENAERLIGRYDLVVDGCDSFETRDCVNRACAGLGRPMVYGALYQLEGQVAVLDASRGPCYRCFVPEPPPPELVPRPADVGVLGTVAGLIGLLQATEVIKLVVGAGTSLIGRIALVDALEPGIRTITIGRDPDCPVCTAAARHEARRG
jgi:adenylyltransferase/sulfurtransferase